MGTVGKDNRAIPDDRHDERLHILLVESDLAFAQKIETALTVENLTLEHCTDVFSARQHFAMKDYALLIIDIQDGSPIHIELIEEVRKKKCNTSCISMVSKNTKQVEQKVRELGVLFYLLKPFRVEEIISIIRHFADWSTKKKKF